MDISIYYGYTKIKGFKQYKRGIDMINVMIDEFTPCLKDARTGELVQTEVIQIKRKSFLKKYNSCHIS